LICPIEFPIFAIQYFQSMTILIKEATIITPSEEQRTDILISDGKILQLGKALKYAADRVINASGKYVFPGGIDPHVHLHLPSPAGFSSDDFISGSIAALFGGTTSIIDFVTPTRGQPLIEALDLRITEASDSLVDYSFHISPVEWRSTTEEEIKECIRRGFTSFKIYLAYQKSIGIDKEVLFKVMKVVGKAGGIVTAHCELGEDVDRLRNEYAQNGHTSPLYQALSRPPQTEVDAVKMAIKMAEKTSCPLYIVHVSSGASLIHIRWAQQNGLPVMAESCPHYLLLNEEKYQGDFEKAAPYVLSPPLRKTEDQQLLWRAFINGTLQTLGTDHCPFSMQQKAFGKHDFRNIPNGAGGIEHRLALLHTYGVLKKKLSLQRFVEISSSNAANIFGFEKKGKIAPGFDADMILWNSETTNTISAKTDHSNCDINIYEGFKTIGAAETVIKGGEIFIDNGKLLQKVPGKLILRKPFDITIKQ